VPAPEIEEGVPADQPGIVVGADAPRLDIDDVPQFRQLGGVDLEDLVDLLLVLGQVHPGPAVGERILDFGRRVRGIQTDCDGAHRDGGQVEQHPLRPVLAVDADPVAGVDAEGQQAVGGVEHAVPQLGPRDVLPDAEVLVAHGHPARNLLRPPLRQRGDGRRSLACPDVSRHCGGHRSLLPFGPMRLGNTIADPTGSVVGPRSGCPKWTLPAQMHQRRGGRA
jgi:hypothetical protein